MSWVRFFHEVNRDHLSTVGGKGANLGELVQAGFPVPDGFCVTTTSYQTFLEQSEEMERLLTILEKAESSSHVRQLGEEIRAHLQTLAIPGQIEEAVRTAWEKTGTNDSYAVRSSATTEDLPTASFAGQQDTYLNQKGIDQLLQAIRRCWASLFTERAIQYRRKNGFDHRQVQLSVVVQKMIFPQVSGILFTADPLTGHRETVSIDASFGLGEALVSGLVSADLYCVRDDEIQQKQLGEKKQAIYADPQGGTITKEISPEKQQDQALSDEQIRSLAALGKQIEAHFGQPQDVEWCLQDEQWFIVQSRPITSLYPVPSFQDERLHVLQSFGHKQMMTDPMSPLALSIFQKMGTFGIKKWGRIYHSVGNRLYTDMTDFLYFPSIRKGYINLYIKKMILSWEPH